MNYLNPLLGKNVKNYANKIKCYLVSTACVRTQAQNYHEQLSANRDEFSQGSIPNPLVTVQTLACIK